MTMLRRGIEERCLEAIASRRVTVVTGPRQSGKTTLVRALLSEMGGTMRSLDEQGVLAAARADPEGFVASGARPLFIDEVQRGGEPLIRAIKAEVDRDDRPGQFVLTGSSNFLMVPGISESLAGRVALVEVWPFTQGELAGRVDRFIELAFDGPQALSGMEPERVDRSQLLQRVCAGGYAEVHRLPAKAEAGWFRDYVRTTIERDVVEMSGIRKVTETRQLLRLFAARSGCELVMQSVIADSALERQAVYDRRGWLETIHLLATVPAWSRNLTNRVKRRPKVFISDPGLAAWLVGKTPAILEDPTDPATGRLVETFVFGELSRQLTWTGVEATLHHWQDRAGAEIDFVLEAADGKVVAIEVKTGQTAKPEWFRWLERARDDLHDRFVLGVVLYTGEHVLPFGDRLLAAPISTLWASSVI